METVFRVIGCDMDCAPRVTDEGRFASQVVVTKAGYHPEAAFRKLGEFDTEKEAVEYAKQFSVQWLKRYG